MTLQYLILAFYTKAITKYQPLVDFKADTSEGLIKSVKQQKWGTPSLEDNELNKKKEFITPRPFSNVWYDQIGHFPRYITSEKCKQHCKLCMKGFTGWEYVNVK